MKARWEKAQAKDLTGQRFGRLVVVERDWSKAYVPKKAFWICRCDCGKIISRSVKSLKAHYEMKSCGCGNRTHGKSGTPIYHTWASMINRCYNPKNGAYRYYGGRGITVCERWRKFENFYTDMAPRPGGLTLERKNTNGNYEPENCVWADKDTQANNRTNSIRVTIDGRTQTLTQWIRERGISPYRVRDRIEDWGWDPARAIIEPPKDPFAPKRLITAGGRTQGLAQWSRKVGLDPEVIKDRIKAGWTEEEAVLVPKKMPRRDWHRQ